MTIAFGLRPENRRKQKSHKLRPGVNSPGSFLPGIEPEQLFVFVCPERPVFMVRFKYRTLSHLFKIAVDLALDTCYIGISKKEIRYVFDN